MPPVTRFPEKERRKNPNRIIWIAPQERIVSPLFLGAETRIDVNAIAALSEIRCGMESGRYRGMIFALITELGRMEMGTTGCLYESPIIAAGMASRLAAMNDSLPSHPSLYLPDTDE